MSLAIATKATIGSLQTSRALHGSVQAVIGSRKTSDGSAFAPDQANAERMAAQRTLHHRDDLAFFIESHPAARLPAQTSPVFSPGVSLEGRIVRKSQEGLIPTSVCLFVRQQFPSGHEIRLPLTQRTRGLDSKPPPLYFSRLGKTLHASCPPRVPTNNAA